METFQFKFPQHDEKEYNDDHDDDLDDDTIPGRERKRRSSTCDADRIDRATAAVSPPHPFDDHDNDKRRRYDTIQRV